MGRSAGHARCRRIRRAEARRTSSIGVATEPCSLFGRGDDATIEIGIVPKMRFGLEILDGTLIIGDGFVRLSVAYSLTGKPSHTRDRSIHDGPSWVIDLAPHPVLDVVVDDEVQFLVRKAIMRRQHTVNLINDRFREARPEYLQFNATRLTLFTHDHL